MKNAHGVSPTRYMKRKESKYAIRCDPDCGPLFSSFPYDIYIDNNCNEEDSCYIGNNSYGGYKCNCEYKKSLFVNTTGANENNLFAVLDYEVYTH